MARIEAPYIRERFRIMRQLGVGGMGIVYEAIDRSSGQPVALKTMRATTGDALLRFKQEFRALQGIHHANLVRLGDLLEEEGHWWFSMELVRGVNLLSYVHRVLNPPLGSPVQQDGDAAALTPTISPGERVTTEDAWAPPESAPRLPAPVVRRTIDISRLYSVFEQLVEGLHALHLANKVHRDIKPENVLVTEEGRVVILDFGLIGETMELESGVLGTIAYMAPEQAAGRPVGTAADWYSVGVLLYEALTGQLPFDGPPLVILADKQLGTPVPAAQLSLCPADTADLAELCMELLRTEPAERPDYAALRARLRPASPAQPAEEFDHSGEFFVGRSHEMEVLSRAFAQTRSGEARVALLSGESGVGKSALLRHFADKLTESTPELLVLTGRCYEHESVPFKAIDGLVDSLARTLRRWSTATVNALLPRRTSLLLQTFPVLGLVPAVMATMSEPIVPISDPHEQRLRVFAALRELLGRMADRRPLLLLIEDLQWTDADSVALLANVMSPPDAPPLLVVATLRPGTQVLSGTWLDAAQASERVQHLTLAQLPNEEALELARRLVSRSGIAEGERLQRVVTESEGHPLFIRELLRQVTRDSSGEVPRLEHTLWSRIVDLPEPAQQVLRLCAMMGSPLTVGLVTKACALPPDVLERSLARLRTDHLVRAAVRGRERDSGAWDMHAIEPYHDRIREVVVEHLAAAEQQSCHRRLVTALEASGGQDPEALCYHADRAGLADKAFAYALQSAAKADQALAFERAARFYDQALTWLPSGDARQRELRVKLAHALANAGRSHHAAQLLVQAAEGAEPQLASALRRQAGDQFLRGGYYDEGLSLMQQAFHDLALPFSSTSAGVIIRMLLTRLWLSLRGLRFRERPEREIPAIELARIDLLRACCSGIGGLEPARGVELTARSLLQALRIGDPVRIALGLSREAHALAGLGGKRNWKRAQALLARSRSLQKGFQNHHAQADCTFSEGLGHYCAGHWSQAARLMDEAESLFVNHCTGVSFELASLRSVALNNKFLLGQLRSVPTLLSRHLQDADSRNDRFAGASLAGTVLPIVLLIEDQSEQSTKEVAERLRQLNFPGFSSMHISAVIWKVNRYLYAGQGAKAHRCRQQEIPGSVKLAMRYAQILRIFDWDQQGRCLLALASESSTNRPRLLGQAAQHIRALHREQRPFASAFAQNLRAALLHQQGSPEEAAQMWQQAAQSFDGVDMKLHAAAARRRQGQLHGGAAGKDLITAAEQLMRQEGIKNPARWTAMLAPATLD